jgi:hypothetical protein
MAFSTAPKKKVPNLVDHVGLVFDGSSSMAHYGHDKALIKVADGLIEHLAKQSKELGRQIRVSVFQFTEGYENLIWEMDVLHVPSIAGLYEAGGNTALWSAIIKSQRDLATIPQKYGDHGFVTYVITDGENNRGDHSAQDVAKFLATQPDNVNVAILVPNQAAVETARRAGVPGGNIEVWDTTSAAGIKEAGASITRSYDTYAAGRTTGTRGSKNLFGGAAVVNKATISAANLKQIDPSTYKKIPVIPPPGFVKDVDVIEIAPFVRSVNNGMYLAGSVYYPVVPALRRNPRIGPEKNIVIMEKKTGLLFTGPPAAVRALLRLPVDGTVTVKPDTNPEYLTYVQSTSPNRHLTPHTEILMFTGPSL